MLCFPQGNIAEVKIDHGTPLVCQGQLTGFLSNVVRPLSGYVGAGILAPCSLNATAYYSRFDANTGEWIKRTINGHRPNAAHIGPGGTAATHVTHWSGTGAMARPTTVVNTAQQPYANATAGTAAGANAKQGKSGATGSNGGGPAAAVLLGIVLSVMGRDAL